ncbi:MAG: hypothetical protein L3K26_15710 [Candidatus Hydrogenedentes bacterium]|nr:hypothetical protein [Candidatus Hydrogenedentota bacterium]
MTQKEKVGVAVIVALFAGLALTLYLTIDRPTNKGGSFENNVIIDQRVRNLNK